MMYRHIARASDPSNIAISVHGIYYVCIHVTKFSLFLPRRRTCDVLHFILHRQMQARVPINVHLFVHVQTISVLQPAAERYD